MGFEERSDIYSEIRTEHMDEDWGLMQFLFSYFSYSGELGMLLCFCLCVWGGVEVSIKTLNKRSLTSFLGCMLHWELGDFL